MGIEHNYTTTYSVYRVSSSVDINNFEPESLELYSTKKGLLEPLAGNERYMSDRREAYTTHRLFTGIVSVTESDEIHIGSYVYDIDLIQNFRNNHLELILILRK